MWASTSVVEGEWTVMPSNDDVYERALDAHRKAARVRVVGTLVRPRRRHVLLHPEGFTELPDDDG